MEWENNDRSFHSVNIRYLNFDNVKSLIFTKLESLKNYSKRASITSKIDTGSNGNLILFPKSTTAALHGIKTI